MIDPESIVLGDFVDTWHGSADREVEPLPDSIDWLPGPLKDWHNMARRRGTRLTYSTKMIAPERIRTDDDGKAIFMIDPTGDWRWCFDVRNPLNVLNGERSEPWTPNEEQLADFLAHNTLREAVYGARARRRALDVDDGTLEKILSPMQEIDFPAWSWPDPGYRLFMGNELLAEIIGSDSDGGWDVDMAATEHRHLDYLQAVTGVDWR